MDFDSIVILPFLDFFSFMKSVVGMEQVQVSGRHRLTYDCNSKRANPFRGSPIKTHIVLVFEGLSMLQSLKTVSPLCVKFPSIFRLTEGEDPLFWIYQVGSIMQCCSLESF